MAKALAADNEVWAVARFGNARARGISKEAGVRCAVVDLAAGDYSAVPGDITYGLHFARASVGEWGADLDTNVGGLASLMEFCQDAKAFLHCSSTAVYQPNGNTPRFKEDDPLGDNHRVYESFMPDMQTYSITKIAAEGAARWGARRFDLPTTIARLNVPYGGAFSWPAFHLDLMMRDQPVPVYVEEPSEYNPIHDDDILAMIPGLLARRVGAGDDGELGRQRRREHPGVVRVPRRAHRHRAQVLPDRSDARERVRRHDAHGSAGRQDHRALEGRLPPDRRSQVSRQAEVNGDARGAA